MTPEEIEHTQAMVFLECYGSQSTISGQWHGWKWADENYSPEWLESELKSKDIEPDDCVSVLHNGFDEAKAPTGFREVSRSQCGEKSCPWCGDGGEESERDSCELCEGDGLLYWGEEWSLIVFAPINPDETLKAMRALLEKCDDSGALTTGESREFFALFQALDAYMTDDNGRILPEPWQ